MLQYTMVNIYNMTSRVNSQVIGVPLENAVYLSLFFFPPCYTVTTIHSNEQATTFYLPVDCFVSFQGPFVFTDSALAFKAISNRIAAN